MGVRERVIEKILLFVVRATRSSARTSSTENEDVQKDADKVGRAGFFYNNHCDEHHQNVGKYLRPAKLSCSADQLGFCSKFCTHFSN